jgi:ketosteroid isomerase-like protein
MSISLQHYPRANVGFLTLLLLQASTLLAQDETIAAIQKLEEDLNRALVRCDSGTLGRLWDDRLAFVFPNGSLATKQDRLTGLERCTPGSPSSTNESVDVRVFGDVAVAIVLSKWAGSADGKPFASRFRATHIWAKRPGGWALVAAHVSQLKE